MTTAADLVVIEPSELVDVTTGERLPVTTDNAIRVIGRARAMKARLDDVIRDATAFLVAESRRVGTKTLHAPSGDAVLKGGTSVEYDPIKLMELLREADCPEERIAAAVVQEVSYKVNRSVLKQLGSANADYQAAIELASETVEKSMSATVTTA